MALIKKVKRPVLKGEQEYLRMKGLNHSMTSNNDLVKTTNVSLEESNNAVLSNQTYNSNIYQLNNDEACVGEMEKESVKNKNHSAMNRIISFLEENVRMPRKAKVEEDDYYFRIDNITSREGIEGKFGTYDQFLITFSLSQSGMDVPIQITLPYTVSSNPESPLMMFLVHFKPIFQGQSITIKQLVGLQGRCKITHYQNTYGDVYERLEVLKVEQPNQ
ncbi:hypothetical protein P9386_08145 [Caldifermentibacillus hisashii]|uniref:Uncharacterized protein n=1 Tax=Tepidibacillus fermentans TaxID=1281767 RepID=A0A4R3KFZ2_9BACI|nr:MULTISPECIES: hypothetical protein [Bacillaceae]MED4851786.1 hypothetical protein [Caldifermentibacillus hisashii]TCS82130.1 hypothetical protein EDD72_11066 [Tepidibacillus fermentans]